MPTNLDPLPTGPLREDEMQQFRRMARFFAQNEEKLKTSIVVAENWERGGWLGRLVLRLAGAVTIVGGAWLTFKSGLWGLVGKVP